MVRRNVDLKQKSDSKPTVHMINQKYCNSFRSFCQLSLHLSIGRNLFRGQLLVFIYSLDFIDRITKLFVNRYYDRCV